MCGKNATNSAKFPGPIMHASNLVVWFVASRDDHGDGVTRVGCREISALPRWWF